MLHNQFTPDMTMTGQDFPEASLLSQLVRTKINFQGVEDRSREGFRTKTTQCIISSKTIVEAVDVGNIPSIAGNITSDCRE